MIISQDERRVFHRMAIESSVKMILNKHEYQGICKDLSSTGISIRLSENIVKAGDKIEIKLGEGRSRFPPFNALGTVVRISEDGGYYTAAIELTSVI